MLFLLLLKISCRTVCSADIKKITNKGQLNEFLSCHLSPLPGKTKCLHHYKNELENLPQERIDFGVMTRSRRQKLGLSIDVLTTDEGCRKRENVTQRTERSKTAGTVYIS